MTYQASEPAQDHAGYRLSWSGRLPPGRMRVPRPEAGEVVIRVQSVGICASDLKCYQGAPLFWGDETREGYCQPPVIPGHEFVGEVVALGEGAGEKLRPAAGRYSRL